MGAFFDELETRPAQERERELFTRLPAFLKRAVGRAPGLAKWLSGVDLDDLTSREALTSLPVMRKDELGRLQAEDPPFGGFVDKELLNGNRVFVSPGPIWEPQGPDGDWADAARAFFAAGIRPGDIVHNVFAHHMTPGGFMLDAGARALGCIVFPAGTGNTDMQVEAARALRPQVYCGTPDFLKTILDHAEQGGSPLTSFRRGFVSAGALFPSLREEYRRRGIDVFQCYATAEFGIIAYETESPGGGPNPGMVVNEDRIVEIVRPGTGEPVAPGEVGEIVVTGFNPAYPLVRLGTGDLSAFIDEPSPCGRTNRRIKGWMGRADQRTKVKGMFIDPKQIAEIVRRHPQIARARLVVSRSGERDTMTLHVEPLPGGAPDGHAIESTLREVTKLGGTVEIAAAGSLPNDGKVVADERDYER